MGVIPARSKPINLVFLFYYALVLPFSPAFPITDRISQC